MATLQDYDNWTQEQFDAIIPFLVKEGWINDSDSVFRVGLDDDDLFVRDDKVRHRIEVCASGEVFLHGVGSYPLTYSPRDLPALQSWETYCKKLDISTKIA